MPEETSRRGKVARLPDNIRQELNLRLLNGEPASKILPWLNALPETAAVVAEQFDGEPITDSNLSNWRAGGFGDWKRGRDRVEQTRALSQLALELAKANNGALSEGGAAIAGGKILELLETVAAADLRQAGGDEAAEGAGPTIKTLTDLTSAVAQLRHGDQQGQKLRLLEEKLRQTGEALVLAKSRFERETAELFLKWYKDKRAREIAEGKAAPELKRDQLIELMFGSRPERGAA